MLGNLYDFLTQCVFWLSLLLFIWFGWHWWHERKLSIAILALTYLTISVHYARIVAAYAYDVPSIGVDTWWAVGTTAGLLMVLMLVVVLAVVGRLTKD
jgi:hypothetical protein